MVQLFINYVKSPYFNVYITLLSNEIHNFLEFRMTVIV